MSKQRQQQNLPQSRDGGYTIIESLVAMIVVSVLMIAIAPVMAFSVATRVQARRIELATQAARTYIAALRTGAIKPNDQTIPGFPIQDPSVAPPPPDSTSPETQKNLYCVNLDEKAGCDGSKEFYVQGVWRNRANPTDDPTTTGYELTVRVYRADGFTGGTMKTTQQSVANSALGDPKAPLVVMKTEIPPTTVPGSYGSLCSRILDPKTGDISATACK
jgi:prepilin-type N-terminal cleavage/methylation domain-containing protein